jgi:hypothetical protein
MIVQGIDTWLLTGDTNDPASTDSIVQLGWFQVLKGYIPHKWNLLQEGFFRSQGKRSKYKTGEQWTNQLITFFWTHSHALWKDRCAAAHAPSDDSPDNSSARSRKAAQQRVETVYAHGPIMLANDRRVLDVPLAERLQSRTSDLIAWAKIMLPVITQSVRDARAQMHTGHNTRHRNEYSAYQRFPTRQSAALPARTNNDRHALHRHPPVLSCSQQRHLNISDQTTRTSRIDKLQRRSQGQTCRRSGSDFSQREKMRQDLNYNSIIIILLQ